VGFGFTTSGLARPSPRRHAPPGKEVLVFPIVEFIMYTHGVLHGEGLIALAGG